MLSAPPWRSAVVMAGWLAAWVQGRLHLHGVVMAGWLAAWVQGRLHLHGVVMAGCMGAG